LNLAVGSPSGADRIAAPQREQASFEETLASL
jgi:hypothetical protein